MDTQLQSAEAAFRHLGIPRLNGWVGFFFTNVNVMQLQSAKAAFRHLSLIENGKLRFLFKDHNGVTGVADDAGAADNADDADDVGAAGAAGVAGTT